MKIDFVGGGWYNHHISNREMMNVYCDLHTHSVFSDGTATPEQIILQAKEQGLSVALADHNTVAGVPSFLEAAKRHGVTAVAGIELTTAYNGVELHLLGLFVPEESYPRLNRLSEEIHDRKEHSNREMIAHLCEAGYDISYENVRKRSPIDNINRSHVAAELMDKGYVSSMDDAFDTLLKEGNGFYAPTMALQITDAIRLLCELRVLPILAHPLQELTAEQLKKILPELITAGLVGMETYHSSYDDATILQATAIAREFHLVPSGGSDYHGDRKPLVRLGVGKGNLYIPVAVLDMLKARYQALYGEIY